MKSGHDGGMTEPENDVEKAIKEWADSLDEGTRAAVHEHFAADEDVE
jgi:hypothetical protein